MIAEGSPAPDFELTSDAGERIRLSSLRGKPVVLFFYPKDDMLGIRPAGHAAQVLQSLPS